MSNDTMQLTARIDTLEKELGELRKLAAGLTAAKAAGTPPPLEHNIPASTSRRDLLCIGAAAVGAAAATLAPRPAEAADGANLVIGVANSSTSTTALNGGGFSSFSPTRTGVFGSTGTEGVGIYGRAENVASGTGVVGESWGLAGAGVTGLATGSPGQPAPHADGVAGYAYTATGAGVHGINVRGNGVLAEVPSASTENGIALYALNYSSYAGPSSGAGGFAIYGLSAKGHGLVGATAAAGAAAVVGASNGVGGAYAGAFYGPVAVAGDFTVVGGAKSAAVPHPDGSHRRLYCVESPESWFEDFGEATLVCGEASIRIDSDFAAVVDATQYHVFLTAYDSDAYLNVLDRTPDGFRVRASEHVEGRFSWRVVAKRKDIAGPRFERVEIPKAPAMPAVPPSAPNPRIARR